MSVFFLLHAIFLTSQPPTLYRFQSLHQSNKAAIAEADEISMEPKVDFENAGAVIPIEGVAAIHDVFAGTKKALMIMPAIWLSLFLVTLVKYPGTPGSFYCAWLMLSQTGWNNHRYGNP